VDPRHWDTPLELRVNCALGMGTPMERAAILGEMLTRQEAYIEKGVPFVDFTHLHRTLTRVTKLMGFQDPSEFWGEWGPEQQQAYVKAMAENPQEDPAMAVVETERMKLQQDQIFKQDELEIKRTDMLLRDKRERDEAARDAALKEFEIELKYMTDLQDRQVDERVRLIEVQAKREQAKAKPKETAA
jgi:hypothetical protein